MKATELRIGNYVDCFGIKTVQSIMITPTDDYKLELNEKRKSGVSVSEMCLINSLDLKPIPLTEEWLLKFGAKEVEDYYNINIYRLSCFANGWAIYEFNTYYELEFCIRHKIKYVHELQNIYHALTGEELTLNKEL